MKKNNKNPKVQILLATYNGEKFLRKQLDSIINQKYKSIKFKEIKFDYKR